MNFPMIIAHRGASYRAPENTLAAVNLAWELKADAVEIDIRLTKDEQVVVIHNPDTLRVSGKRRIIRRSTLAQLRRLDFGRKKGKEWSGERIPTLAEVLDTVPENKKLVIEIKGPPAILPFVWETLRSSRLKTEQFEFLAFNYRTAAWAKKIFPGNAVYFLYEIFERLPSAQYFIKKIQKADLDGLDISVHPLLSGEFIDQFRKAGKRVMVWTENDPRQAARWMEMGVAGITTDRPGWLREQLKKNYIR